MGQLINLKCSKCGYETNLGIGSGLTYNDLEKVLSFFDNATKDNIRKVVSEGSNKLWYVYKEIARCEKCGKISAIAVFKTTAPDGREITYHAKCQCGSNDIELFDSEKIIDGKATIACPICGDNLEVTVQGHWD